MAQGAMDVIGMDGGGSAAGGGEPGGLGQKVEGAGVALAGFGKQVDGGGFDNVAFQSRAADLPVEVGGDVLAGQGKERGGGADAREDGSLNRESQTAKEASSSRDRAWISSKSRSPAAWVCSPRLNWAISLFFPMFPCSFVVGRSGLRPSAPGVCQRIRCRLFPEVGGPLKGGLFMVSLHCMRMAVCLPVCSPLRLHRDLVESRSLRHFHPVFSSVRVTTVVIGGMFYDYYGFVRNPWTHRLSSRFG